ncbi:IucA/IucC family siderophore biosynthesis protein [Kitasatospora sp. GP82]|uniref:IucA/IucC family protein n=1 Tax=Kitasatospora sp. GP82 TaxID=3035089 RepID=UPI00247378BF|nr:IucA/IucC family siderophore biosynthesis protein [Kitasatospora sp. GP82]MDH6127725.1 siderophore synthetase component [Kitasatospora sp. GP82]
MPQQPPADQLLHRPPQLTEEHWQRACRAMLAKMLGEFAYEELITPVADAHGYRLDLPGAGYRYTARRGAYGSWQVDPDSITCTTEDGPGPAADRASAVPAAAGTAGPAGGPEQAPDPLRFLQHARRPLGLTGDTLGHLLRELTATLLADTRQLATELTAAELADLGHVELEGRQNGHPWIVPNKGRIGFSARDTAEWTPEARTPQRLPWLAVHRSLAQYRGPADLYQRELDAPENFRALLGERAQEYHLLPVHPWQWDEVILPLFAPQIAAGLIVPLPSDGDLRLPQQSIRSFFNLTRPERCTVKLPLSILNTLVWRGLPTERTLAAPAVTAWIHGLRDGDPFLRDECRVILLGEIASVAVDHPVYRELPEVPYQYKELLGAIWREPLGPRLRTGERARTLASLLSTGSDGRALVAELVARSGLPARDWLRRLFAVMMPPLLHFLYQYGTVFSPHGENAIVVFDECDRPVRLAVKDFVDDVNITDQDLPELADLPAEVSGVLLRESPEYLCQFLHSGLFIGVYRYLAPLYERQLGVPEDEFWTLLRERILAHQRRFPELADRFKLFDLLSPRIDRLCLNRNRLLLDGYRDRPQRPHAAVHGQVDNALCPESPSTLPCQKDRTVTPAP